MTNDADDFDSIAIVHASCVETEAFRYQGDALLRVTVTKTSTGLRLRLYRGHALVAITDVIEEHRPVSDDGSQLERIALALECLALPRDEMVADSPWPVERLTEPHSVRLTVGSTTSGMSPAEARALALELLKAASPGRRGRAER